MVKTSHKTQPARRYRSEAVLLPVLCALVVLSFYPVTQYYFAQDDFVLLNRAAYGGASYFKQFFGGEPGQFRPLSKAVYFSSTYRLFGLNPYPYHIVSLLFHLLNVVLFYVLMTRLKIRPFAALAAAALFGLSVTVMNVVGWIACIQQLLGECFLLLSLLFGIGAVQRTSAPGAALSVASYVLAVMCMEQTWPVPLIVMAYAYLQDDSKTPAKRLRGSVGKTAPLLVALLVYVAFLIVWKGIPASGDYTMNVGANVAANLAAYTDRVFQFSVLYPFTENVPVAGFTAVHLLLLALVFYNVARGRGGKTVWALLFFVLTILPTLLLTNHAFYIHVYIPALGPLYLLAMVFDDFFDLVSAWKPRVVAPTAAAVLGLVALMSTTAVRANETNFVRSDFELPNNFVLRRALIAGKALEDAARKTTGAPRGGRLYLISQSDVEGWYSKNVAGALGNGDAFRLFYDDPGLEVLFINKGETIADYHPDKTLILIYDDMGNLYTLDELERQTGRPAVIRTEEGSRGEEPR